MESPISGVARGQFAFASGGNAAAAGQPIPVRTFKRSEVAQPAPG
jgi:hypothetical protein